MERYENLGLVGEGSYGMVLKCRHKESNQVVAIKKFIESEDDKMVKKIALREIKMLKQLRHENLVNLLEVFRRKKRLFLVFEFVDRTVLDDLEKYPDGLKDGEVKSISFQVLRGLEFCHNHNVIHRDVKPENILISKSGVVKLCDFGFARTLATGPGEVFTDYVATRWYRAPELLVGDVNYGKAVDIWAVGCLLFEMATGDPLFPGDSDIDQLFHITKALGNLTQRHQEVFHKNPLFTGLRLPSVKSEQSGKKFIHLSTNLSDLITKSLALDVIRRCTCLDMMKHAFFQESNFSQHFLETLKRKIEEETSTNPYLKSLAAQKSKKLHNAQHATKICKEKLREGTHQHHNSQDKKKKHDTKVLEHSSQDKQQHSQLVLPMTSLKTTNVTHVVNKSGHTAHKSKAGDNNKLKDIVNVRSENIHENILGDNKDNRTLLLCNKKSIESIIGNNSEKCIKGNSKMFQPPPQSLNSGEMSPDGKFYHRAILDLSVNQPGKNLPEICSSITINRARGHDVIKQKKMTASNKKTGSNKQNREAENAMLHPVAEKATLYFENSKSSEELLVNKRRDSRPRDPIDLGLPKVSGLVFPSVKNVDSNMTKTSPTRGGNRKTSMAPTIPTIQNIDPFSTQFTPTKESSNSSRNNRESNFPAV